MIVLDASAVVELLLGTAAGQLVLARLDDAHGIAHAPHLLDVEVVQALRRYDRLLPAPRIAHALQLFDDLGIHRHEHAILLPRVWQIRENLTAYDATYIALAEALDLPLVTRDRRLAKVTGNRAIIEVV